MPSVRMAWIAFARRKEMRSRKIPSTRGNSSAKTRKLLPLSATCLQAPHQTAFRYIPRLFPCHPSPTRCQSLAREPRDRTLCRSGRQPGSPSATSPTTPKSKGSAHTIAGACVQYRTFPVQEHRCGKECYVTGWLHRVAELTALTRRP